MRRVGRVGRRGRCNACGRRWSPAGVPRADWSGIRRRPRWSPVRRRSGEGATQTPRATVWARRFAPGGKRWGQGVGNVSPAASAGATRDFRRELQSWHLHPRLRGHQRRAAPSAAPEGSASAGAVRALATLAGGGWTLRAGCAERVRRGYAVLESLVQPGEVRRKTSGPSNLPDVERLTGQEHVGAEETLEDAYRVVLRGPRDMVKAKLPEPQSPAVQATHSRPQRLTAVPSRAGHHDFRGAYPPLDGRLVANQFKGTNGAPTSRSNVHHRRNAGSPTGREPYGDGVPVVVAGVTTAQGARESRAQGEGGQVIRRPTT